MSNAETPAENSGGPTATPTTGPLADLPNRIRVHALAKLLAKSSRDVLAKLTELGEATRSAQSSVPREVALKVAAELGVGSEAPAEPAPPAGARVAPARPEPVEEPTAPTGRRRAPAHLPVFAAPSPVFLPPEASESKPEPAEQAPEQVRNSPDTAPADHSDDDGDDDDGSRRRRRRGRRGRGRGKGGDEPRDGQQDDDQQADPGPERKRDDGRDTKKAEPKDTKDGRDTKDSGDSKKADGGSAGSSEASSDSHDDSDDDGDTTGKRRRRRRRRKGGDGGEGADSGTGTPDDPPNTVTHVRETKSDNGERTSRDGVRSVRGSTRLEAKRQRRRDGREAGRRRAPILSEAEFLTRRESVERTMVVAEHGDSTQIGVLEDSVLVEHFVTSSGSGAIVGNVYLGRVQNVLPSMEAAFIDIGRGRNAVLYAGEVDWDAAGLEGKARKIEQALSSGDSVLVQVTKDPIGHKGARLTTQISLPGRFLVYVPAGGATGISRKLPENERRRLKDILKRIVPEDAGVIIRTASEGVAEEELDRDVRRLKAQWDVIKEKAEGNTGKSGKKSNAPSMLYEEPDLLVKVVRDLFTEDFVKLEVQGNTAWETIHSYVQHVAPDLADRLKRYTGTGDVFADYRIDEQITKALDRKVWLPSGGYLVIDRTEAMTVIDVNTGKYTGSGGNLEETVTRNNLESAEEIVRQLRLRDIGGIIVIDFIDMVLESNRELVLRRLTECLGRDRTRHQVAEVTSLGLVQMTRKRVGTGLIEAFSTTCEHCKGRGVLVSTEPQKGGSGGGTSGGGSGSGNSGGGSGGGQQQGSRRSRGRGKGEEPAQSDSGKSGATGSGGGQQVSQPAQPAPTPEQRESVVSAVQAMAQAAKVATKGDEDQEQQPSNGHRRPDEPAAETGAVTPASAGSGQAAETASSSTTPAEHPERAVESASAQPQSAPDEAQSAPARPTRRRARRVASRPAGPPVNASENG